MNLKSKQMFNFLLWRVYSPQPHYIMFRSWLPDQVSAPAIGRRRYDVYIICIIFSHNYVKPFLVSFYTLI